MRPENAPDLDLGAAGRHRAVLHEPGAEGRVEEPLQLLRVVVRVRPGRLDEHVEGRVALQRPPQPQVVAGAEQGLSVQELERREDLAERGASEREDAKHVGETQAACNGRNTRQ